MKNKIFLVSDTHFYHEKLIKIGVRPEFKTVEEMNEYMIEKWNSVVGENDIVIHMGDVFMSKAKTQEEKEDIKAKVKAIFKRLKGRKLLILGNHDRTRHLEDRGLYYDIGFEGVEEAPIMLEKIWISHEPIPKLDKGVINYFGHFHNNLIADIYKLDHRRVNVSVELHDYTPILVDGLNKKDDDEAYTHRVKLSKCFFIPPSFEHMQNVSLKGRKRQNYITENTRTFWRNPDDCSHAGNNYCSQCDR